MLPRGIPILPEEHEQYPDVVKRAWEKFHEWWVDQPRPANRADMPQDVANAMDTILQAPIPGHPGATGKDSCYMIGVQQSLQG